MQSGDSGHWWEFERMISRLGALRLADKRLAKLLDAHPRDASDPLVAAFAEALDAVSRFRDAPHDRSSTEAWAALHRAYDTARVEDRTMPPVGGRSRSADRTPRAGTRPATRPVDRAPRTGGH
jgi:hypothetical protein